MNLILIGYRGSGKTTVARRLSELLGWPWLDSDVEIERASGHTIAHIFAEQGEATFRDLETAALERLCRRDRMVLAVGGGAVLRDGNQVLLRRAGKVVWLAAAVDTLHRRIGGDATTAGRRPNLTNVGGRNEVVELLAARTSIYRAMADLTVDTENKAPDQVATEIVDRLNLTENDV
ncbi:MAG: shikimate kinase [Pirellulales bacterium]